jgi:hypothetical protein
VPRVILEVTERATLDAVPNVKARVAALRDAGHKIAIDDLGAGYAGLTSFVELEQKSRLGFWMPPTFFGRVRKVVLAALRATWPHLASASRPRGA